MGGWNRCILGAYLLPLILNRNAECSQAMILCVVTGAIGPRHICGEDVPDTVLSCCHEHATSFKNIFRTGSETLEKSVCSRYTCLVGRFVHGGSLLCAFLYGAVFELPLEHSSFLCHRHTLVTPRTGILWNAFRMGYYTLSCRKVKRNILHIVHQLSNYNNIWYLLSKSSNPVEALLRSCNTMR